MAGSMNKAIIIGRVGQDPKLTYTQNGQAVVNFSVATDEGYRDKQTGQKVEKTEWHRIVAWRQTAEFVGNYVGKGRMVAIEGKIETRKWQDQNGQDKYTTEINAHNVQALDRAPEQQSQPQQQSQQGGYPQQQYRPEEPQRGGQGFPTDASGTDEPSF